MRRIQRRDIGYFLTATLASRLGASFGDAHPRLTACYGRMLERPSIATEVAGLVAAARDAAAA